MVLSQAKLEFAERRTPAFLPDFRIRTSKFGVARLLRFVFFSGFVECLLAVHFQSSSWPGLLISLRVSGPLPRLEFITDVRGTSDSTSSIGEPFSYRAAEE